MKIYDTIFYILYRSDKSYYEKMYNTNEDENVFSNAVEAYMEIIAFEVFNIVPILMLVSKFSSFDFKPLVKSKVLFIVLFLALILGLNAILIFAGKRYLKIIEKYDSYPREVIKRKIWYLVVYVAVTVILLVVSAILTW